MYWHGLVVGVYCRLLDLGVMCRCVSKMFLPIRGLYVSLLEFRKRRSGELYRVTVFHFLYFCGASLWHISPSGTVCLLAYWIG